jgi:hypothetical protein
VARLCIRILPNLHPTDANLNDMRTQAGDVVCIVDDGHVFSKAELECGHYRIIDVPGVSQAELTDLIDAVFDADGSTMTKRRKWTLPIGVLDAGVWKNRTTATKAQIDAIKALKV